MSLTTATNPSPTEALQRGRGVAGKDIEPKVRVESVERICPRRVQPSIAEDVDMNLMVQLRIRVDARRVEAVSLPVGGLDRDKDPRHFTWIGGAAESDESFTNPPLMAH
jgi:hypothetical protein